MDLNLRYSSEPKIVTGSTVKGLYTKELHRNMKDGKGKKSVFAALNYPEMELDLNIVKAASESYKISPNIEDYIIVPLPIVTVDIPNRNMQAFTTEEVFYFDPQHGKQVYKTFDGKALFENHNNQDPLQAKGIIVDSGVQFVKKFGVWKICIVTLWDRTKDEKLVNEILKGTRDGYSMGALVMNFVCSICGKIDNMDDHTCEHMNKKGGIWGDKKRLSYQCCLGTTFFETSSVGSPADSSAISNDVFY